MSKTTAAGPVLPNPQGPKTIGLLNIIFASGLMLWSLCSAVSVAMMPLFSEAMKIPQQQLAKAGEQQRAAELQAVADQEQAATTEQEKEDLRAQRREIQRRPKPTLPPTMDMAKMGLDQPPVIATVWLDVLTSLVLNTLMIVAGVGLIRFREWGRRLSLWVAGLKILRLAIVSAAYVLVFVPVIARGVADMMADMMAQQQAAMGRGPAGGMLNYQELARIYGITYTVMYLAIGVFGAIYPAISLWVLTRPGAVAACRAGGPSRGPEPFLT